jgi:hypothetical protein
MKKQIGLTVATFTMFLLTLIAYLAKVSGKGLWKSKKVLYKLAIIFLVCNSILSNLQMVVYAPKPAIAMDGLTSSVQDKYIFTYATKFQRPDLGKTVSLLRYQLACLAHKENGFHANDNCGDSGQACGMYQFHQPTYVAFRKIMIAQGLTDHIGSRLNDQDAVETTAWAITHGHESDWGPMNLGMCQ